MQPVIANVFVITASLGALPFFGEQKPGFRVKVAESRVLSDLDHVAETLVALEQYQASGGSEDNPMEAPMEVANELEMFLKDARKLDDVAGNSNENVQMSKTLYQSLQSAEKLLAFIRVETRQAISSSDQKSSFEEYQAQALNDMKIWVEKVETVHTHTEYPAKVRTFAGQLRKTMDNVVASLEGRVNANSVNLEIVPSKETLTNLENNWKNFMKVCQDAQVDELTAIREASLLTADSLEALLKFVGEETTKVALEVARIVAKMGVKLDEQVAEVPTSDSFVLRQLEQEIQALGDQVLAADGVDELSNAATSIKMLKSKSETALMDASDELQESLSRIVETLGYLEDAINARVFAITLSGNVFQKHEVQAAIDAINEAAKKGQQKRLTEAAESQ